jgi:membrane-associated protease RseP (regulator of RpoE activity)
MLMFAADPAAAQNVAAPGQPPALPGRFGFALECRPGCTWVEPAIDHSYFRHRGPPRVSLVQGSSAASRAGLRVGDEVVGVGGDPVTTVDAGLQLASDTLERLVLEVSRADGSRRTLQLVAPAECRGSRGVVVSNHSGLPVDVYMTPRVGGDKTRALGQAAPGVTEFTVPLTDSAFRAEPRYFWSRRATGVPRPRTAREQLVNFKVVCHD